MMTNLTEQKGKKTHYYINLPNGEVIIGDEFALSFYRNCKDGDKVEVLDKVSNWENHQIERKIIIDLTNENTKLKELLKECKHIMSIEKDFASCHFEKDKLCNLLNKINQVLGEE